MIFMQDQWLITWGKAIEKVKTGVKKVAKVKKKLMEKKTRLKSKPRPKVKTNF